MWLVQVDVLLSTRNLIPKTKSAVKTYHQTEKKAEMSRNSVDAFGFLGVKLGIRLPKEAVDGFHLEEFTVFSMFFFCMVSSVSPYDDWQCTTSNWCALCANRSDSDWCVYHACSEGGAFVFVHFDRRLLRFRCVEWKPNERANKRRIEGRTKENPEPKVQMIFGHWTLKTERQRSNSWAKN